MNQEHKELVEGLDKAAKARVKASREATDLMHGKNYESVSLENTVEYKAAAAIRRLSGEVEELKATNLASIQTSGQLIEQIEQARELLQSFADYADHTRIAPPDLVITQGSSLAKRQLTMADCYAAADFLARKGKEAEWRDIESAPKDGTKVIGLVNGVAYTMSWQAYYDKWPHQKGGPTHKYQWTYIAGDGVFPTSNAQWWMPLPTPPQQKEGG